LRGRSRECAQLDQLLAEVRDAESQVLVIRGDAGVGKSALLDYLVANASDCRITRAVGIESEMELAFAGLHQLCAPMLDLLHLLSAPQADAITTAFGLSAGEPPDRFLIGLAVLSLLSEAAEQQPLLCVVDDAQWLDGVSAQVLAFVARRLFVDPIALVFAVRQHLDREELAALPELTVLGLRDADARALLDEAITGRLDARVRDRIVAETHGNPLALLEIHRGLTPAELAGGFGLPTTAPISTRIEASFMRRLRSLPDDSQRLLLVAAAEPLGDVNLLWRATALLGISPDAAGPPQAEGLMEADT
jgi:predicted ATPase